jgi:hypothetical protein
MGAFGEIKLCGTRACNPGAAEVLLLAPLFTGLDGDGEVDGWYFKNRLAERTFTLSDVAE